MFLESIIRPCCLHKRHIENQFDGNTVIKDLSPTAPFKKNFFGISAVWFTWVYLVSFLRLSHNMLCQFPEGQKAFGKSRKNGFGKNQKSLKKLKKIPENLLTLVFGYATM